jgi:hypothetical protein
MAPCERDVMMVRKVRREGGAFFIARHTYITDQIYRDGKWNKAISREGLQVWGR